MKQKWIAGLLAVSMMAAMAGCAETTDSSSSHAEETSAAESSAAEETEAEDITEAAAEETEFQVELLGTSVSQDYEASRSWLWSITSPTIPMRRSLSFSPARTRYFKTESNATTRSLLR